ncbi:MAG TPA: hypothetical protein VIK72_15360 [Clostridiaceae bacterium]
MKMNKARWIITILGILWLLSTCIHYKKFSIVVGLSCCVLILIFMIWHYSDKFVKKETEKNN